MRSAERYI